MPLRRLARLPAAAGERVSKLLHTFVFSLPTPANGTANTTAAVGLKTTAAAAAAADSIADGLGVAAIAVPDPGASRALAAGIGPLSFVGSGYGMTLAVMAILLNRIHHIVQHPRPPPPPLPHPPTNAYRAFRLNLARWLTSDRTPSVLRVPGLIGLVRAWLLFTVVTMQTAELWPLRLAKRAEALNWPYTHIFIHFARRVDQIGAWAGSKDMADVCWNVFLCVCSGLIFGALGNGLERARRRDVGAGFNLFGFSFLLHLYSSPLTHHMPPPTSAHGRPDVHALFHLWLGLTELTWLQAIELSPKLRRNQLLPTGVCGAIGLIHFVYALATAPLRFPSFTFMTHLLALLLSVVIMSTIILRAITHLFTVGYIPSPVWAHLLPHEGAIPTTEDDAGVALLKLGTACIEATTYSGLRNELAPVQQMQPYVQLSANGCDEVKRPGNVTGGGFDTRIDDIQVTELTDPNDGSLQMRELQKFAKACLALVSDIFWCTLLGTPIGRRVYRYAWIMYHSRWWYGPRQWQFWRRQAWAAPRREPQRMDVVLSPAWSSAINIRPEVPELKVEPASEWTYDQVLRGEVDLPDDEDEWEDGSSIGSVSDAGSTGNEDDSPLLYRDLVVRPEDDSTLQPILLAHMTSGGTLTRRRYAALRNDQGQGDTFTELALSRRAELAPRQHDEWDEERRRACVVCMTQPRDIIVWPCRCLLMCNDCRESLAARLASKDHACPNCRTKVDGYSRIYIP